MKRIVLCKVVVVFMVMLFSSVVFASKTPDEAKKEKILNKAYRMSVPFIENRGQIENQDVDFYARTFGGTVFVEEGGILTYYLPSKNKGAAVIKEILTENEVTIRGLEPSPTRVNYFKGKDRGKWKTNIPSYESVSLGEIYKGIELKLKAYGNNLEKLFTVLPEGNPESIRIKLEGVKGLKLNEEGELEVITELGSVKFTKPLAYQEIDGKRIEIAAAYTIKNPDKLIPQSAISNPKCEDPQSAIRNPQSSPGSLSSAFSYGFKVGDYNKNYPLIIDPLLASTFIGGGGEDGGNSIAIDESGNVYLTGNTKSSDYPTTTGAYDESYNDTTNEDVFVSKLDNNLSSLLASTFLGGDSYDYGRSITIDGGNVYVTGQASSTDFPTTSGAYKESGSGGFISKLDSNLSTLLASTIIPSTVLSIALDGSKVYVTGYTWSSDFPTTTGAYDRSHNGNSDFFVSKLDSDLTTLLASTFLGGSGQDINSNELGGRFLDLDGSGNVYVTGRTASTDFPTTTGAYDRSHYGSSSDLFVSKLDSNLTTLLASTFLGGSQLDWPGSIVHDGSNLYVTGYGTSTDYPTTTGAYNTIFNGGWDGFVSKLDSDLTTLLASTFLGGSDLEWGSGYCIVHDGSNLYVTGYTKSNDYPTTTCSYDRSYNYGNDVYVSKLDSTLSTLLKSTFIGGSSDDVGRSIVIDGSGNLYVTGFTKSSNYPTVFGAYDESHNGGKDVFVSKLDNDLSFDPIAITPEKETVCTGATKEFSVNVHNCFSPSSYDYYWEIIVNNCGGEIDPDNGIYTAGCSVNVDCESDIVKVTDTINGCTDTAVVKTGGYRITGIVPDDSEVESDETVEFSTVTLYCCPIGDPLFQWSIDPPSTIGSTIDPDTGEYRAGINETGGNVSETIKVEDVNNCCGEECASKEKSIQVKPCTVMNLQPKENNIINARESINFRDDAGTCCPGDEYTWELTVDEGIGSSLNATGLYRAGRYFLECQPVTERIMIADACDSQDTADVTVRPVQVLVDPESATVQPEDFIVFEAPFTLCKDVNPCYTWSLNSGSNTSSGGVIIGIEECSSLGVYIAGPCNGADIITVTDTANYDATANATVTVENGIDCEVYISPISASVNAGETQQFSATKFCNFCDPCSWEVISDIGSVIDANGLYTAGSSPGTDTVKIICSGDEDTAEVTVSGSITTTTSVGPTTTTSAGPTTTTTVGPTTTTTAGPITTTTVGPTTTTTTITDTSTTTTITDTTTTTTIITKSIEVSPSEVVRSRWIPLFALMYIKGEGTNFELFKTRVEYDSTSVLKLPALVLSPTDIYQIILIMPSLLTGIGFDGESETVTVMVEGVSDTFEIKMLPAPLDEEKNLK